MWGGCNSIPEDLHPKSFRAAFGHNTNIWLMQDRKAFKAMLCFCSSLPISFFSSSSFPSFLLHGHAVLLLPHVLPVDPFVFSGCLSKLRCCSSRFKLLVTHPHQAAYCTIIAIAAYKHFALTTVTASPA